MILAKCLNSKCGYQWFGRRVDQNMEFVYPNNCPKCRKKKIENTQFIFQDRENVLKNYFTARYYKVNDKNKKGD